METKILETLYTDPAKISSLGGVERLYKEARKLLPAITRQEIQSFLQTQEAYTRHKPIHRKFKRRKVIAVDINDMYQCDLADMQKFAEFNDGIKYLFTCIDVFSKFAFAIPIKSKKPN